MPKPRHKKARSRKTRHHAALGRPHRRKHATAAASVTQPHHHKRRASHAGGLPGELRKKLERPVTVKTLKDIVALRRVQRGA